MKYILILLIAFTSFFMSCDRRTSKKESLQHAISEFKHKQAIMEVVTYIPKEYTQIVTDTVIESKVNVHINNYSLMDDNVVITTDKNSYKKEFHRSFESEIVVYRSNVVWFKTLLNAKTFADNNYGLFWNNATLQHAWVNQEESNGENISIMVSFVNPSTESYRLYQLYINETGIYKTSLKENFI